MWKKTIILWSYLSGRETLKCLNQSIGSMSEEKTARAKWELASEDWPMAATLLGEVSVKHSSWRDLAINSNLPSVRLKSEIKLRGGDARL